MTLTLLRSSLPAVLHDVSSLLSGITGGHAKIVIGVLALLVTALTVVGLTPQREHAPLGRGGLPTLVPQPAISTAMSRIGARVRCLLDGANPWVGFMSGRNRTTPWVEYLTAMSVIFVSGAALGSQVHGGAAFSLAILAFVQVPLVCYIVNPKQTRAIVVPVHNWVRAHRRVFLAVGAGVLGVIMAISGMAGI